MTPDRERDLLDANNRYLEEARIARRAAAGGFQARVDPWLLTCFGETIARDRQERAHRFLEEAIELVQAAGTTASEAHQLVDYVFARPVGELPQESGGVSVTHAAFCLAHDIDMAEAAERELARVWTKVETIRAKQAAKPKHSPLPEHVAGPGRRAEVDVLAERERQKTAEGWTAEHDDKQQRGQIAYAAASYALASRGSLGWLRELVVERLWPWNIAWFKPTTRRRDLVKAGALILAEIERLDRAAQIGADGNSGELAQNHDLSRAPEVDASAPTLSTPGAGAPQ